MSKRSLTSTKRKVRTRKTLSVVENFDGYTTKKLKELAENPVTDSGLEVNQEAAYDELMRRYDAMSDDMIREYTLQDRIDMVSSPVGFDWDDEEITVIVSTPVLLLPIIPPPAPENWESIPPPVPAWLMSWSLKNHANTLFLVA